MVASQLVLVNHFFLALVHNTPDPATVPDFNSVVVDAGCNRGCRLCSPVNGCLSCEPPFFLVLQRDGVRQTASCTKTCPRGFFKVKKKRNGFCSKCTMLGCEECLGPHYCSTCQQHYFNYFGKCIRETPGKNKTEKLGITTEHTLMAEDVEQKYGNEDKTKTEEEEKEKEEGGIQIMLTSLHRPTTTTTTTTATATIPNTTLPSPTLTPTPRPSPSPLPSVPTPTTSPPSPSSDRDRGRLRPCRRRHRRRRKHKHGRKETEKLNRRNRNKERRKDAINRRRQCGRRGRGGRGGRRGRRKGKRWGGRRREKKGKTTTTTITNATTTSTTITITTEIPTTTQMIDLSLLGEEDQMGNSHLAGSSTQLDGNKFFYNNQPREMARFKQSNTYRRKKPAYVKGKRVRHAKLG